MNKLLLLLSATVGLHGCAQMPKQPERINNAAENLKFHELSEAETNASPAVPADVLDRLLAADGFGSEIENRFDINANSMPAKAFFLSLVSGTGQNIVVPDGLKDTISLSLKNVTLEEALDAVSDVYGYDYEKAGYGYRIFADQLQTRLFEINYLAVERQGQSRSQVHAGDMAQSQRSDLQNSRANAQPPANSNGNVDIQTRSHSNFWSELQTGLEQILSSKSGRTITVSPQSGVVVVTATNRELRQVKQLLKTMEANVSRQVMLEAKILEVTLNDGFQAGINWNAMDTGSNGDSYSLNQIGGGTLVNGSQAGTTGNTGQVGQGGSAFPSLNDVAAFGGAMNLAVQLGDFGGFIELLKQQGDVQVLSSPRVSTLNNQKAVIKVGTDQFFVTDITSTTTNTSGGISTSPSVGLTPFFSGIALDVTPQVSADDTITLHVHPTISNVNETNKRLPLGNASQEVPLATANIRESDSVIRARSGEVVVIGGLMQTVVENQKAGVPGLSDLPVLGSAFRHRREATLKKELVILLRPVVIQNGEWSKQRKTLGLQGW